MLEFDDIQYILLTRVPALTGRYEFLSFQQPAQGRAWLEALRDKVPSAKAVADTVNLEKRWVSVAFTWNGLRTLGVDEASLATFPEEFRQGMASGTSRPSTLAVLRLITVSYLVGACTGRSPGFSPLRMRIDVAGGAYRFRVRVRERALILQGVRNRQAGWRRFPGCACR